MAVAWIQSYIQDPLQRELLQMVHQLSRIEGPKMNEASHIQLEALRTNLFRMWSEVS